MIEDEEEGEWRRRRRRREEVSSENPFGDFQSLLFHARQRRTGHVLGPHGPCQAALFQHKVIVGSGVHGVEDVGVVRDPELCRTRSGREKQQVKLTNSSSVILRGHERKSILYLSPHEKL